MTAPVLDIADLRVDFGTVAAVRGISLQIARGETHCLVGESGCGKSVTSLAVMGLLARNGRRQARHIRFQDQDLLGLKESAIARLRGDKMAMIFQEPMTSLNPAYTIGSQMAEVLRRHRGLTRTAALDRAAELLSRVGITAPGLRLGQFPHQLSGGLRQRVMIAIAVARRPRLLIADEPTTALDVTIQAQIMALLETLRRERGMALLLITHDLGLVAQHADRVVVMYAGLAVEEAPAERLFRTPLHPYTKGLLASMPGFAGAGAGVRRRLKAIPGSVPHPSRVPPGCPFRDRCGWAAEECGRALPELEARGPGHRVRCARRDVGV